MKHGRSRARLVLALGFAALGLAALPSSALAATADLSIAKSDSADPAAEGAELSYTLVISNAGPDTATAVSVSDDVPNELDIVAATATQGNCDIQGRKVACELGSISSGASATVTIRVRPRKTGQISNTATVETADTDPQAANNTDTETTLINEPSGAPTCFGRAATIVGTTGADTLTGTAGTDVIVSLGGNDLIDGLGGNDLICSAAGVDVIRGAGGADRIRAGGGPDSLRGGSGNDLLRAGGGDDRLAGGPGNDELVGGTGRDRCRGGPGRDTKRAC